MAKVKYYNKKLFRPFIMMCALTLFQLLSSLTLILGMENDDVPKVGVVFASMIIVEWIYFIIASQVYKRQGIEIEIIGFFLTSVGLVIVSSADPDQVLRQAITAFAGLILFIVLYGILSNLSLVEKLRYPIAIASLVLFAINVVFGRNYNGARNWIRVAGFTFQPSELIKVAFIFVGAATLERIQNTKHLTWFILYSVCCFGALFIMKDFGTACIFFFTFLVITFVRSGDVRTIVFAVAAAIIGIMIIIYFKPYVADRFATYRHIWDDPYNKGYQQTRGLIAISSGGLLGMGLGNGNFKHVAAATEDLVFAVMCEEYGILFAFIVVLIYVGLAIYTYLCSSRTRSSYYAISSCAAASLMLFQAALNIFGSADLLPFTGVTLPFISQGGSSIISCWGLLAFIKIADTRGRYPTLTKQNVVTPRPVSQQYSYAPDGGIKQ